MRSHVTVNGGVFAVTACKPREGSVTHFDPVITLSVDENWLSFTATLTVTEARQLADVLQIRADEAEGR